MEQPIDYREYAATCRMLARHAESGEQWRQLVALAETWERLAERPPVRFEVPDDFATACGFHFGSGTC